MSSLFYVFLPPKAPKNAYLSAGAFSFCLNFRQSLPPPQEITKENTEKTTTYPYQ